MIKLKSLLDELKVSRLGSEQSYLVAWKDRVFLFGDDTDEDGLLSIYYHLSAHPHFEEAEKWLKPTEGDAHAFFSSISDFPLDVVTGMYYPEQKELYITGVEKGSPITSKLLPK